MGEDKWMITRLENRVGRLEDKLNKLLNAIATSEGETLQETALRLELDIEEDNR